MWTEDTGELKQHITCWAPFNLMNDRWRHNSPSIIIPLLHYVVRQSAFSKNSVLFTQIFGKPHQFITPPPASAPRLAIARCAQIFIFGVEISVNVSLCVCVCGRVDFVLDRCEDTAMVYICTFLARCKEVYLHDGVSDKKWAMMKVVNACLASKFIQMNNKRKKQGSS